LDAQRCSARDGGSEYLQQMVDRAGVRAPGRRHVDDLAFDHLDAGIRREDAHFSHAVVIRDRKPVRTRRVEMLVRHAFTIGAERIRVNGHSP
jgi:hypothetical protein